MSESDSSGGFAQAAYQGSKPTFTSNPFVPPPSAPQEATQTSASSRTPESYDMSSFYRNDSQSRLGQAEQTAPAEQPRLVSGRGQPYPEPQTVQYPPSAHVSMEPSTGANASTGANTGAGTLPMSPTFPPAAALPPMIPPPVQTAPALYAPSPLRHPQGGDFHTVPLNDTFSRAQGQTPSRSAIPTPTTKSKDKNGFFKLAGHKSHESVDSMDEKHVSPLVTPGSRRNSVWDFSNEWQQWSPAEATDENLKFAEGDAGTSRFSRFYLWACNKSIVFRWTLYIIPVLALLWIPGIVWAAGVRHARVWGVPCLYWSIWLSVMWLSLWGCKAFFMIFPRIFAATVCVVAPSAKQYVGVVRNLGRYAKFIVWALILWISFQPLIQKRTVEGTSDATRGTLNLVTNLLLAFFFFMVVLGVEKLVIQLIALSFHRDSYADRIAEQKFAIKGLTRLYQHSSDVGRSDTLRDNVSVHTKGSQSSKIAIRRALKGLKNAAQSTTTALGNMASELGGSSVLQPNSPANKVKEALDSPNKSRSLGRRLYYSFRHGKDHLVLADIARYFPDLETAEKAFRIFDRDGNGDATRDEIDAALTDLHRERLALEASMRDLDGAVGRLDEILLVVAFVFCVLILSAMITSKISSFITSTGTFILSLSWMIGTTMQEILLACIFLFVKHPYDVGDRVDIDGKGYTVAKMELMSTSFKRVDGKFVWIGHNILATKVIENVRRSGATSETFTFEVAYHTTFEKLQDLRALMLRFCKESDRDFLPIFDIFVDDIPAQGKMVCSADIRYKSNWQQGALKAQRRNKWICQLKMYLAELQIWGPLDAGNPDPPPPDATRYTQIPWEEVQAVDYAREQQRYENAMSTPPAFAMAMAGSLVNRRDDTATNIWDDRAMVPDSNPPSRFPSPAPGAMSSGSHTPIAPVTRRAPQQPPV